MKLAVIFDIKDGTSPERAKNLALGIAIMAHAAVRDEPDVKMDLEPSADDLEHAGCLGTFLRDSQ